MIETSLTLGQQADHLANQDRLWQELTDMLWNEESDEMQLSQASIMQSWNTKYSDCGLNDGYDRMIKLRSNI